MEEICSREFAEMFVALLLKGVKNKIAVRNDKDELEFTESSLINHYLNPYNDRKRMTKKIAEALNNTFEYMIFKQKDKEDYFDLYSKAIIFIYSVSRLDLTYFHNNMKENQNTMLKIIKSLFQAFAGKESLKTDELENPAYKNAFDDSWNKEDEIKEIDIINYYRYAEIGDDFHGKVSLDNLSKSYNLFESYINFLNDLICANSIEEFSQKYKVTYINKLTRRKETIRKKGWKKFILSNLFDTHKLIGAVSGILTDLSITNNYLIINSYFNIFLKILNKWKKEKSDSKENREVFESYDFKEIYNIIKDASSIIQLRVFENQKLGTFGSCHCMFNSLRTKKVNNFRQFVSVTMDFLFGGVATKKGCDIGGGYTKEIRSDIIYKYINEAQKDFTVKVMEALYYRIKYHFSKNSFFYKMVWQLFYYVFGIDLYMLDNEKSENKWLDLFDGIFKIARKSGSMEDIRMFVKWKYDCLWFENESERFTPEEINFFRRCNSKGFKQYIYIFDNLINMDMGYDILNLKDEMSLKYTDLKIKDLLKKLENTVQFFERMLRFRSIEESLSQYKNYSIIISDKK